MSSETDIQRRIQIALSWGDSRMFRNNVGEAWLGRDFTVRDGRLINGKASRVVYGLCNGSSDLIGIHKVTITPAMLGREIGAFVAIEVKRPGKKPSDEQDRFMDMVMDLGGIAGVARSEDEAKQIVTSFTKPLLTR